MLSETQTREQNQADLFDLARQVTAELPGAWSISIPRYDWCYPLVELKRDADAMTLHLQFGGWQKDGRVGASLHLGDLHQFLPYNTRAPEITVAANRAPQAIGKDVARRLLPDADSVYTAVLARKAESDAYDKKQADVLAALRAACPLLEVSQNAPEDHFHFYGAGGSYADGRVSADSVHFERVDVPVSIAVEIAKLLNTLRPA